MRLAQRLFELRELLKQLMLAHPKPTKLSHDRFGSLVPAGLPDTCTTDDRSNVASSSINLTQALPVSVNS
ncbi:hypothetical protein [Marilutibacter maris]|uniref:hypothetical protein n=1 Tax=Marilutibacter maris TaxID=1605891 RepID=UPI0020138CAC|nr:hypothetical protein [Lysobacter maris]